MQGFKKFISKNFDNISAKYGKEKGYENICSFVNCKNTSMKSSMSHLVFMRPFTTLSIKINFETEVFSKIIEDL